MSVYENIKTHKILSDCCLTPMEWFFNVSWWEQVTFWWDDDDVCFVLDQQATTDHRYNWNIVESGVKNHT